MLRYLPSLPGLLGPGLGSNLQVIMAQPSKKKAIFDSFRVGDTVRVRLGGQTFPALVIEDRGDLGPGGSHLLRVEVRSNTDEPERFEIPVDALVQA
jgi:hypothetical protein